MTFSKKSVVGIVGSGAMGTGIAQVAAMAGHNVLMFDTNITALGKAKFSLELNLQKAVEKHKLKQEEANTVFSRINLIQSLQNFADCDLIIEAIIEDLKIKQQLFHDIENIVSKDCVLATNTSSLSIASISSALQIPKRFLGIHFFNPAHIMPLVEIIPGILTDTAIVADCKKLIDEWGKLTVLAKDTPGFIVNRVARSFYGEAIRIYEEGFADLPDGQAGFATIDWAMKEFGGFKMGPFELMDFIGNDINYKVTESVWEQFFYEPRFKPSLTQKRLFEAKLFGHKSGKGYYNYSDGVAMPVAIKNKAAGEIIFSRILTMLINEAADTLYLKIATKEDIDLAMTKGVNYPKGLLKWADEIGIDKCLGTMEKLYAEYNEDRYRPSTMFRKMKREGKTKFYE
jgi:3-hydroxybutyryl-CoA dehydrogenase